MAKLNFQSAALHIQFLMGTDEEGNALKKKQTIHNIMQTATAADLQTFAQAYASLYDGELYVTQLATTNEVL